MKFARKDKEENTDLQVSAGGEERIASLFQPDALLGEQYLDNFRRKTPLEPEKSLVLAVLKMASDVSRTISSLRIEKSRCCSKRPRNGFLATNRMEFSRSFPSVLCSVLIQATYGGALDNGRRGP